MIITRTPFRVTLGGGGTDLPSFYSRHGGFVFTMAINKFMYIMLHKLPVVERKSIIRYSRVEYVSDVAEIQRTCLCGHEIERFDADIQKLDVVYTQVQVLEGHIQDLETLMREIRSDLRETNRDKNEKTP